MGSEIGIRGNGPLGGKISGEWIPGIQFGILGSYQIFETFILMRNIKQILKTYLLQLKNSIGKVSFLDLWKQYQTKLHQVS